MTTDTTPRSADAPMRLLDLINANWMAQAPHAATRMLCIDCDRGLRGISCRPGHEMLNAKARFATHSSFTKRPMP